jgi:hypothetical protein
MNDAHYPYVVHPFCETWGDGPWKNEGNVMAWVEPRTQLHCALIRHPHFGAWRGYVGLPPGHPLWGKTSDDDIQLPVSYIEQIMKYPVDITRDIGVINLLLVGQKESPTKTGYVPIVMLLPAHGGLTYHDADDSGWWWFGFDAMHAGDVIPCMARSFTLAGLEQTYRDQDYMQGICTRLAWAVDDVRKILVESENVESENHKAL